VCVVHFCNFDWLVKKAWMLPHPALSTSVTQNCTSFLNSPIAKVQTGPKGPFSSDVPQRDVVIEDMRLLP
jgi:hypothetical protein